MPNFKRIGGGPWKYGQKSDDLTWNDPMVFNSMLIHGVSPESMLVGTMIPIPKDRRQLRCTSDNFRAITLSSIVGKLLDLIILSKEQGALLTSQLQFGFKENMSTTQCTYVMQETISYYNANGSNVYGPFLLKLPYYHQNMTLVLDIFCFYKFYIFLHDNGQVHLS